MFCFNCKFAWIEEYQSLVYVTNNQRVFCQETFSCFVWTTEVTMFELASLPLYTQSAILSRRKVFTRSTSRSRQKVSRSVCAAYRIVPPGVSYTPRDCQQHEQGNNIVQLTIFSERLHGEAFVYVTRSNEIQSYGHINYKYVTVAVILHRQLRFVGGV